LWHFAIGSGKNTTLGCRLFIVGGTARMVWSKELAKLKQGLKAKDALDGGHAAPAPAKQAAPPMAPRSLEEEDALFLTAVGRSVPSPAAQGRMEAPGPEDEFAKAMSQLRGIKPSGHSLPIRKDGQAAPAAHLAAQQGPAIETEQIRIQTNSVLGAPHRTPRPSDESIGTAEGHREDRRNGGNLAKPEEFQLAAGMVIEVDGQLDLRNHNEADARERLAEKVLDGQFLGWRSLHVILGTSDTLRQVLRDYLDSPQSGPLAKDAQAPVPMGGNKAWILYYHSHSTS
jgi:hypothetical protein